MICGGASDLTKTTDVLDELGIDESELTLLRYRGYGNPGPTRIETRDGRAFEVRPTGRCGKTKPRWLIQPRCKICPDVIGDVADLVASDVWLGGPTVEDEALNGIIVRTNRGLELYDAAIAAGALTMSCAMQALPNSTSCNRIRSASAAQSGRG